MKKIVFFIFILIFNKGFCQNNTTLLTTSKIYQNKAIWFQNMPHYNQDSSAFYFEKAIALLKKKPSHFNVELATIYYQRCELNQVNYSFNTLDSLAKIGWSYLEKKSNNLSNKEFEYRFLSNWAIIKIEVGQNKEALQLFTKALLLVENIENSDLQAEILLHKGNFYERYNLQNEQKIAYQNLTKSVRYFKNKDQKKYASLLFSNYKSLINYFDGKNQDSVFYYSDKIKLLLKHITIPQKHAWYYVTSGRDLNTYPINAQKKINQKQYDEAKNNIIKSLVILEKYKIKESNIIPYAYGILADIYVREKKYDLAIENYKNSKKGYELLKNKSGAIDMNQYIAEAYRLNGNLDVAITYFKEFYKQSLAIANQKNERSLRESELQINVLKQDKEIVSQKAKISQNKLIQLLAIGIVTLLIGLLIFGYISYHNRNRSNQLLAIKNAENELLLKEIHHRVKNNLEVVSSLLALQSAQINDQNTKDAMAESQNRVNSIGIVHQKLYQGTNLGAVEMKDYFLNLSESIFESFGAEQRIDLKLAMENLDLDIDTAVPLGLIVNELLTNCIKYAFPKGEKGTITIKLHKNNNILRLEVADDGIGKSGIIHGTGFGGQLVSLLTQQLNGTITEENKNGTSLVFDFKLKKAA